MNVPIEEFTQDGYSVVLKPGALHSGDVQVSVFYGDTASDFIWDVVRPPGWIARKFGDTLYGRVKTAIDDCISTAKLRDPNANSDTLIVMAEIANEEPS